MVLQKPPCVSPGGMDTAGYHLQKVAEAGCPSQDRLLARKPQAWKLLTWSLLAIHSVSVLMFLVLFCDYAFYTDDHKKAIIL